MFSTPERSARHDGRVRDDLPPLHDTDSDYGYGPGVDPSMLSEEEVLSPRLVDLDAYRKTGTLIPPELEVGAEPRPAVQWPLVVGLLGLAVGAVVLMSTVGLVLVGILWAL